MRTVTLATVALVLAGTFGPLQPTATVRFSITNKGREVLAKWIE